MAGLRTPPNAFARCSRSVGSSGILLQAGGCGSDAPVCLALISSSLFFLAAVHAEDLLKNDSWQTNERGVWPGSARGFGSAGARGLAGCFMSFASSIHGRLSGWAATLAALAGCKLVVLPLFAVGVGGFVFASAVGVVVDMSDCVFSCSVYGRFSVLAATLAGKVSFTLAVVPPFLAVGVGGFGFAVGDGLAVALAASCFLSCPVHQGLVNLSGLVATLTGRVSFALGAVAFSVGVVGEFFTNLPSGYECFGCKGRGVSFSSTRLVGEKLLSDFAGRFSCTSGEVTGIRTSGDRLASSFSCGESG